MSKLGPSFYDCNENQSSCTRRGASPQTGCKDCKYTMRYEILQKELKSELSKLKNGTRAGARKWPISYLMKLYVEVASLNKKKSKKWTVVVSALVNTYKGEEAKKRQIESFNTMQSSSTDEKGPMLTE